MNICSRLIGTFLVATVFLYSSTALSSEYALDESWPKYPGNMQFEMGSGVAVDSKGIVYLFTRDIEHWAAHPLAMSDRMGRSTVSMFDASGAYLGKWGPSDQPGFALGAHAMYIDSEEMFWFVDRDGHVVKKYDREGNLLLTLGELGKWGNDSRHFNGPTAVIVQANGNLVVADGYWNSRLVWFDKTGKFLKSVGTWGRGPEQFNTVHALAQDSSGRLLVADLCGGRLHPYVTAPGQIAAERKDRNDSCLSRIQILDAEGHYLSEWTHVNPLSIATYGNRVYASHDMSNLVILEESTGKVLEKVENIAIYVHQMAMSLGGDIYVASVYPEHAGEKRGIGGPSHRRWTKSKVDADR